MTAAMAMAREPERTERPQSLLDLIQGTQERRRITEQFISMEMRLARRAK